MVNYNRAALTQFGLSVEEVNKPSNPLCGASSGQVFENERRFDWQCGSITRAGKTWKDVQNLLIATPTGEQIPLQVADVQIKLVRTRYNGECSATYHRWFQCPG